MTVRDSIQEAGMAVDDDAWRGRVDTRLSVIERDVGVLKADVGVLKDDVGRLESAVAALRTSVAVLGTEMRWLRWVVVVLVALQIGVISQLLHISSTLAELAMRP